MREFGFFLFNSQSMIRHVSFQKQEDLEKYVREVAPRHIYYSSAFYEKPSDKTMENKNWISAELIFDIDADHIDTPCKKIHDRWICLNCGNSGKGNAPQTCPKCKSTKIKHEAFVCNLCLQKAKEEVIKIVEDFLVSDFGVSKKSIEIFYSGHRGYHIHVMDDEIIHLGQAERREIVNYITGINISPELHGLIEKTYKGKKILFGPRNNDLGWRGRLVRALIDLLSSEDSFQYLPFSTGKNKLIKDNRALIINALKKENPHYKVIRGLTKKDWSKLLAIAAKRFGGKIDGPVTADIKRLIRLPASLHGKSGFIVKQVSFDKIDKFDPFIDAIAFRHGEIKVKIVGKVPKLFINNTTFGPLNNESIVNVPLATGIYLLSQDKAELV